jgi:hypothetical protein
MRKSGKEPTMKQPWRLAALLLSALTMAACASPSQRPEGLIDIDATLHGQPGAGVECTVRTASGSWNVLTPGTVNVGSPNGDLHVLCTHPEYRASEVIIRAPAGSKGLGGTRISLGASGGFGGHSSAGMALGFGFPISPSMPYYPAKVVVDMTPLDAAR